MANPATNAIGVRLQEFNENLLTWGLSPNLNDTLQVLANVGVKWNDLTINVGATTTISETNYSTTNDTEVATIKLVAGTIAAAFSLVLPGRDKRLLVWNATGYACTLKLSATTGFALPTGRFAIVATDGVTDVYNLTPNFGGVLVPTTGSADIPAWSAVETAIAAAGLPATAGTVLVSGTDTTAGYLASKLTITMGGLTTTQIAGLTSVTLGTKNAGANEEIRLTVGQGYVGGFLNGGVQTAQFTPVVGTAYDVDLTANVTINLSGMTTPQVGQEFKLNYFGKSILFLLGTVNGASNKVVSSTGNQVLRYSSASWGWNFVADSAGLGANFSDPGKFIPVSGVDDHIVVALSSTVVGLATDVTFHTYMGNHGTTLTATFAPDAFKTLYNGTATTKGEVGLIYGPRLNAAGTTTFRITRDGAAAQTLQVSTSAGTRVMLVTGLVDVAATTPRADISGLLKWDSTASYARPISGSRSAVLMPIDNAKEHGVGLFEFSRSLLVEIATSDNVLTNAGSTENTVGMNFRTLKQA